MSLPSRTLLAAFTFFFAHFLALVPAFAAEIDATPQGTDAALYANHTITITQTFCQKDDYHPILTDSRNEALVGGLKDPDHTDPRQNRIHDLEEGVEQESDDGKEKEERKWDVWDTKQDKKTIIFTKPGTYTISGICCKDVDYNYISCDPDPSRAVKSTITIIDPASIQPDELKSTPGACELCHGDWPEYNGQETDPNNRCYSKEGTVDEGGGSTREIGYGEFKTKPIGETTCIGGYVCDHTIGCVLPTGGLKRPPLPCKRGIKYVEEKIPINLPGAGTTFTKEVETTDPKEIEKCLEFDTGIGGVRVDIASFVTSIMGILLSISGMIALYLIIRSGYQLMTSRGNPEAIQEARERLTSAIVGLLFIIFSLVIMSVVGVDLLKIPGFGG